MNATDTWQAGHWYGAALKLCNQHLAELSEDE